MSFEPTRGRPATQCPQPPLSGPPLCETAPGAGAPGAVAGFRARANRPFRLAGPARLCVPAGHPHPGLALSPSTVQLSGSAFGLRLAAHPRWPRSLIESAYPRELLLEAAEEAAEVLDQQ